MKMPSSWHPSSHPRADALRRGNLHTERALRLGTVLLRSAHKIRESQVDTWTRTPIRYIRFMVNRIRYVLQIPSLRALRVTHFSEHWPYGVLWPEVFGVSCPIVDLIVGVQTVTRVPFVSLFQVLATDEEKRWNRSKSVREAKLVETCEGVQVKVTGKKNL